MCGAFPVSGRGLQRSSAVHGAGCLVARLLEGALEPGAWRQVSGRDRGRAPGTSGWAQSALYDGAVRWSVAPCPGGPRPVRPDHWGMTELTRALRHDRTFRPGCTLHTHASGLIVGSAMTGRQRRVARWITARRPAAMGGQCGSGGVVPGDTDLDDLWKLAERPELGLRDARLCRG